MSATIGKKSTLTGGSYGTVCSQFFPLHGMERLTMLQISSGPNGVAVEEAHGGSRIVEDFREQVSPVLPAKHYGSDPLPGQEAQEGPSLLDGTVCYSSCPVNVFQVP